jgi:hypothetical protein
VNELVFADLLGIYDIMNDVNTLRFFHEEAVIFKTAADVGPLLPNSIIPVGKLIVCVTRDIVNTFSSYIIYL